MTTDRQHQRAFRAFVGQRDELALKVEQMFVVGNLAGFHEVTVFVAQIAVLGAPFLVGAGVKLVYNYMLYQMFKGLKPPEEIEEAKSKAESEMADV